MPAIAKLCFAAMLVCLAPVATQAQTPTTWNFGTIPEASYTNKTHSLNCSADGPQATSAFGIGSSGTDALMNMQIFYTYNNSKTGAYRSTSFYGVAHLLFTSPTSGTIAYDEIETQKMPAPSLQFSQYSATYDSAAGTLAVAMTVTLTTTFPCTLAVTALYRMP